MSYALIFVVIVVVVVKTVSLEKYQIHSKTERKYRGYPCIT